MTQPVRVEKRSGFLPAQFEGGLENA